MKQTIRLTESEIRSMIEESVKKIMNEENMDEGFWDQIKQGAKSFVGQGYGNKNPKNYRNTVQNRQDRGEHTANALNGTTPMNFKGRWNAAKTGFKEQGNVDNANAVIKTLQDLIQSGDITADMSVKQVINKMTGNRLSAQNRVSKANNNIYKGMTTGVMGSGRHDTV